MGEQIFAYPIESLAEHGIRFSFYSDKPSNNNPHKPKNSPISFQEYRDKFDKIISYIDSGEIEMLNFTQPTPIISQLSLEEIYEMSHGLYKCIVADKFVCFSPESFIKIKDNKIHTYPMKGTIKDSPQKLLDDAKELHEHTLAVDLLMDDLSKIATDIKIESFRYITEIKNSDSTIYQTSSHISATLSDSWRENFSSLLKNLLPAGSISGIPKERAIEITAEIEGYDRGFYCGVFGYFDGESIDSGVAIRYIEKDGDKLIYKSGGGITANSNALNEYNEMIDKIYIP